MEKEIQYPYVRRLTFAPIICVIAQLTFVLIAQQASDKDVPEDRSSATNGPFYQPYKPEKKDLIYQYLLGNIAWNRGQFDVASEAMVAAARISADKETTIRAYSFSIDAGKGKRIFILRSFICFSYICCSNRNCWCICNYTRNNGS